MKCLEIHPQWKDKIIATNILKERKINEIFDVKFDVIISCECLYYLSDNDIRNVMKQFSERMTKTGRFYATMQSWVSECFKQSKNNEKKNGLTLINKLGRVNTPFAMNIIENEQELEEKFDEFRCEYIFRNSSNITGEMMEHFHFIGKKNRKDGMIFQC